MHEYSVIIEVSEEEQYSIPLVNAEYKIGRSALCDIILPSSKISRHHASLICMPGDEDSPDEYYVIRDNKSSNGVWIGGQKVNIVKMKDKEIITFGTGKFYPAIIFLINADAGISLSNQLTLETVRISD